MKQTHNAQGEELVTDKDLQDWNPLGGIRFEVKEPVRVKYSERKWLAPAPVHPKPKRKRAKSASQHERIYTNAKDNAEAAQTALDFLQKLGYDLSASCTREERAKRAEGWHVFCQCVKIVHPNYSVTGISNALTIKNAPSRQTLDCMFENCKESPYSFNKIRAMLGKE